MTQILGVCPHQIQHCPKYSWSSTCYGQNKECLRTPSVAVLSFPFRHRVVKCVMLRCKNAVNYRDQTAGFIARSFMKESKVPMNILLNVIHNVIYLFIFLDRCGVSLPDKRQQVQLGLPGGGPNVPRYWSNHCYLWAAESRLRGWIWSVWCRLACWADSRVSCGLIPQLFL